MSVEILVGSTGIGLTAFAPYVIRACILDPPLPPPVPEPENVISTPVPPGIEYETLPVINTETQIIDTSPDQIIGCANELPTGGEQQVLDSLFPEAISGDGVINRTNNDIWTYDGSIWTNVGPTPGPQVVAVSVLPPWNEINIYTARVRTRLEAKSLNYSLELLTEVPAISVRSLLAVSRVLLIDVPSAVNVIMAAATPVVSTGAIIRPAVIAVSANVEQPKISTGSIVAIPETTFNITAFIPEQIGVETLSIEIPSIDIITQVLQPEIITGFSAAIPAVTITITALTPRAGGNLGERFDLTVLVEDDLLTLIE